MRSVNDSRPRTIPIRVVPGKGESLVGYLHRLAWNLDVDLLSLERMIFRETNFVPSDLAVPPDRGADLMDATQMSEDALRQMTLEGVSTLTTIEKSWRSAKGQKDIDERTGASLTKVKYCPHCLASDAQWRLEWRLSWVFDCPIHNVLLRSRCPQCEGPARLMRRTFWPEKSGRPVGPDRCWNTADGSNHIKRGGKVCGAHFSTALARKIDRDQELVRSLSRLREYALLGRRCLVGGVEMSPAAFCNEITWLMSILRRYPSQMLGRPSYGGGSQARNFTPREPLTEDVASWLPIALFVLEQPTEGAVCDEFENVMRSAFSAEGVANYDFPRWKSHLTYSSRNLRRGPQLEVKKVDRTDGLRKLGNSLKSAHIPEIIWPEVADSFRISLALGRDSDFDLRTTLALIAKQGLSDREEGANLSRFMPARHPHRSVSKKERLLCSELRANFTDDQLFSALSSGLEKWFASNHMVDYVERHKRFIGWEGIDDKSWAHIEGILLQRIPQASNRAWHHCSHEVRLRATGSRGTQGPRLVPISRLSHEHSWSKMEKRFGKYVAAYTRTCLSDPHRNEDDLFRRFIDELSASEPDDATAVVQLRRAAQNPSSQKAA